MIATMAKPPKKQVGSVHLEPRESFHLPKDLQAALELYVERSRPRTNKSAVIRTAVEEFLERAGLWSPPAD